MNGNDWVWANHPRPGRLVVAQEDDKTLRFTDAEMRETLIVHLGEVPQDLTVDIYKSEVGEPARLVRSLSCDPMQRYRRGNGVSLRDVWHIVKKSHCSGLRLGLTVHASFFSSTPHTFELAPERGFEEVFYFMIDDNAKVLLEGAGLWADGEPVDDAWPVVGGQFAQIPMGYHRVAVLPGFSAQAPRVSYVWCYICTKEEWEK